MSQSIPQEIPQENTEKELTSDRDSENAELSTVEHQVKLNDMCITKVETSGFSQDCRGVQLRLHTQGDVMLSTQSEKLEAHGRISG